MLEDYIEDKINEAYDYMQNDSKKALKIFNDILEIENDNIKALNGKGSTLMKLNRFKQAEKCFNKSLSIKENSSALLNKGNIYKHNNDFNNAVNYYRKAAMLNPNLKNIVNILISEITDAPKIDLYEFDNKTNELIQRGIKLKNDDRLLESLDSFRKAIEINPSCEIRLNEYIDEALTIIEKEFLYNNNKFDINNKVDRLRMQASRSVIKEHNPQKALNLIDIILEIEPEDINTINHKGGILFTCKQYQKAIECFDDCLKIDKDYYYALFNKAVVLRVLNELSKALECFDELLKTPINYNKVKPYQLETLDKLHTGKS